MNNQVVEDHTYVNGHRIAFREQGEGSPVVLIHGIPTNSQMWRDVMPELAKTHRVIAPDMLNYGQSAKPSSADVSINAQSRMLVEFMDALGVRRADLVAHDIGGGVAQLMAVQHPEKIRRLVLMDSVCFDSWPIPEFVPLQDPDAEADMGLDAFVQMMRDFMPNGVHDKSIMTPDLIELYLEPWSSEDGKRAFFRNLRRLNSEYTQAVADALQTIPHESMVMWADQDPFQKPAYATRLAETIPNARLVWIHDAGHWLIDEKPNEILGHLKEFLV